MKNKKLRSSNEAVVGIVVAVLLIGLMVSVIALMQTQYVPKWMKQKEAEHMEKVMDQFTFMKFAIDTQIANKIETPIVTSMTLGSKELPYLVSQRSYGQLDILSGYDSGSGSRSGFRMQITTDAKTYDTNDINGDTSGIDTIQYSSANAYYLDQSFIIESGALITWQSDGYDFTIKPPYTIKNDVLTINLIDTKGVGGKIQASGYGNTAIMTEYSQLIDNTADPDENVSEIIITSNYKDEWHGFMDWLFDQEMDSADYQVSTSGNDVTITISANYPKLVLKIHEINAQVGPGWIE